MDRVYEAGAIAAPPSPPATPSNGYPSNGNPGTGQQPTTPGEWWYHMITEELHNVITAAGITPDHTLTNQLLAALQAGFGLASSKATSGYVTLPGGIIIQWGRSISVTDKTAVTFPIAFPTTTLHAMVCEGTVAANGSGAVVAVGVEYDTITTTSFKIRTASNTRAFWLAIGY